MNELTLIGYKNPEKISFYHQLLIKKVVKRVSNQGEIELREGKPKIVGNQIYLPLSEKTMNYPSLEGIGCFEAAHLRYESIQDPSICYSIDEENPKLGQILLNYCDDFRIGSLLKDEFPGFLTEYDRYIRLNLTQIIKKMRNLPTDNMTKDQKLEMILDLVFLKSCMHPELIFHEDLNENGTFRFASTSVGFFWGAINDAFEFIESRQTYLSSIIAAKKIRYAITNYFKLEELDEQPTPSELREMSKSEDEKGKKGGKRGKGRKGGKGKKGKEIEEEEERLEKEMEESIKEGLSKTGTGGLGKERGDPEAKMGEKEPSKEKKFGKTGRKKSEEVSKGESREKSEKGSKGESGEKSKEGSKEESKEKSKKELKKKAKSLRGGMEFGDSFFKDLLKDRSKFDKFYDKLKKLMKKSEKDMRSEETVDGALSGGYGEGYGESCGEGYVKGYSEGYGESYGGNPMYSPSYDEMLSGVDEKYSSLRSGIPMEKIERSRKKDIQEFLKLIEKIDKPGTKKIIPPKEKKSIVAEMEKVFEKSAEKTLKSIKKTKEGIPLLTHKKEKDSEENYQIGKFIEEFNKVELEIVCHTYENYNQISRLNNIRNPLEIYESITQKNRILLYNLTKEFKELQKDFVFERGHRRGIISSRDLPQFKASRGNFNNIFKNVDQKIGAKLMILIDESYSMKGNKIDIARESCIVLTEALKETKINLCIIGFTAMGHNKIFCEKIYKKFDENLQKEKIGLINTSHSYTENRDGTSFLWALRNHFQKNSDREIPIVVIISDGQPNHGGTSYVGQIALEYTHKAIITMRKEGAKVFGISIDTGNSSYQRAVYGENKYIVLHSIYDLKDNLVDLARNIVMFSR